MKKLFTILFACIALSSQAQYDFPNITLISNWSDPNVAAEPVYGIKYSGIWGWSDGAGSEYAIIGSSDGYYFINVTNPALPVVSDFVAGVRDSCIWREIKTYSHYAYLISDDQSPNTFQIVDLQYLPDSVHVVHNSSGIFSRAHTLFVDGDKLYCASVNGGQFFVPATMAVFSLANPELPVLLRKLDDDFTLPSNPAHDMLVRNDTVYVSAGFDGLFIFKYDAVANQFNYINSITAYPAQGYNHSSALTDDSQTLIFTDEVPEGLAVKSVDVSNLSNLSVNTTFSSNVGATPHNPFIVGNTCYIAYYQDGLYAFDVSDVNNPLQLGYFDTYYQNPAGIYLSPAYKGAWGAYPFLPSGKMLVSDMQNGLFVLDISAVQSLQQVSAETGVEIYPNPVKSNSSITFSFYEAASGLMQLSDPAGRTIAEKKIENIKSGNWTLPAVTAGVYTMKFTGLNGKIITRKLVITAE